jgi:Asp-tRNA(Asn)/Glu-tRNA(Gln) amidotransferase C subunit
MALTREQIENIAHLARLALQPAELAVYQQSLSSIFGFVGELD